MLPIILVETSATAGALYCIISLFMLNKRMVPSMMYVHNLTCHVNSVLRTSNKLKPKNCMLRCGALSIGGAVDPDAGDLIQCDNAK